MLTTAVKTGNLDMVKCVMETMMPVSTMNTGEL
jgi:hypothetical protein